MYNSRLYLKSFPAHWLTVALTAEIADRLLH